MSKDKRPRQGKNTNTRRNQINLAKNNNKHADWLYNHWLSMPDGPAFSTPILDLSNPFVKIMIVLQLTAMISTAASAAKQGSQDFENSIHGLDASSLDASDCPAKSDLKSLEPKKYAEEMAKHDPGSYRSAPCFAGTELPKAPRTSLNPSAFFRSEIPYCSIKPLKPPCFSSAELAQNIGALTHSDALDSGSPYAAFETLFSPSNVHITQSTDLRIYFPQIIFRTGMLKTWLQPMTPDNRSEIIAMQAFIHKVVRPQLKEQFFTSGSATILGQKLDLFKHYKKVNDEIAKYLKEELSNGNVAVLTPDIEVLIVSHYDHPAAIDLLYQPDFFLQLIKGRHIKVLKKIATFKESIAETKETSIDRSNIRDPYHLSYTYEKQISRSFKETYLAQDMEMFDLLAEMFPGKFEKFKSYYFADTAEISRLTHDEERALVLEKILHTAAKLNDYKLFSTCVDAGAKILSDKVFTKSFISSMLKDFYNMPPRTLEFYSRQNIITRTMQFYLDSDRLLDILVDLPFELVYPDLNSGHINLCKKGHRDNCFLLFSYKILRDPGATFTAAVFGSIFAAMVYVFYELIRLWREDLPRTRELPQEENLLRDLLARLRERLLQHEAVSEQMKAILLTLEDEESSICLITREILFPTAVIMHDGASIKLSDMVSRLQLSLNTVVPLGLNEWMLLRPNLNLIYHLKLKIIESINRLDAEQQQPLLDELNSYSQPELFAGMEQQFNEHPAHLCDPRSQQLLRNAYVAPSGCSYEGGDGNSATLCELEINGERVVCIRNYALNSLLETYQLQRTASLSLRG